MAVVAAAVALSDQDATGAVNRLFRSLVMVYVQHLWPKGPAQRLQLPASVSKAVGAFVGCLCLRQLQMGDIMAG